MQPRGSVNPLSVLAIIGLLGGVYYAVIFGPYYLDNMSVGEAIDVGLTSRADEEHVVQMVLHRVNDGELAVGTHFEENADGDLVEKRGLGLTADNVTVDRNEQARTLRISVDYARQVRLKPTAKERTMNFHLEKQGPIPQ